MGQKGPAMLKWREPGRHQLRMMETLNIVFAHNAELLKYLFEPDCPKLKQEPEILLAHARGFSSGQRLLLRVGLDLWNGSGGVLMWELIETLDDENYEAVLLGLRHLRDHDGEDSGMRWRQPKMAY